ncbi:MAG: hypothetical protein GFH27_549307n13 [Chloroflexi bacterium AL-W]|nr:hypothetical protein [Chloroflexi bacterium AL-N1]NOK69045.1 hypothetical protein [Chloroflexi bacterium AL-N10]NOK77028.1 hypothetical protein [Chloroflexi bacterium AL-N5]NOK83673.1 hypothetical protein [Chloroflexi bacterium AL-W]NOK90883.1 hypothetical protein [Chloroflexi bacterium AL-N15]
MKGLHKTGSVAALIEAVTYLIGFGLFFTLLAPTENFNPTQYVAFLADNHTIMYTFMWYLVSFWWSWHERSTIDCRALHQP